MVVGLSNSNKLTIGEHIVSSDCNAFFVHTQFLLFTTLSHTLRILSLSRSVSENIAIMAVKRKYDDSCREVEIGSSIVTVVANGTKAVMQLPRGNLEAIEPRALVLNKIRRLLTEFVDLLPAFAHPQQETIQRSL